MNQVSIPVDEGFALEGVLEGTEHGAPVVVCHPHPAFGGTLHSPIVEAIAASLVRSGMHVLRFNFRGVGASGGKPSGGLVEQRDVRAACAFLRAQVGRPVDSPIPIPIPIPIEMAIAGYSFGALMGPRALALGERVRCFAALGLPTTIIGDDPSRIAEMLSANRAAPTLYVSGDQDPFCEIHRLLSWAQSTPRTRVEVLRGVGHFPSGPHLDDAVARITSFLRL